MDVHFIDTTFRDGSQSLWAGGMRSGMIEVVADAMDQAGFEVIEVPVGGNHMKKSLRDSKEDPWDRARMVARSMPKTVKSCMAGAHIILFEAASTPRSIIELYYSRLAGIGALNRVQLMANVMDECKRTFPWVIPMFRKLGLQVAIALCYTISPRHSDEYYAHKTRELLAFNPEVIYLKDQGGLLRTACRLNCTRTARRGWPRWSISRRSNWESGGCTRPFPRWPMAPDNRRCLTLRTTRS